MEALTYKIIEIVGTSSNSIEDAINNALQRSAETLHHLNWFEVVQTRGTIKNGKCDQIQVILKVGLQVER